jgi:predicted DNA-binding transcriptional regulator AlpA
MAERKTKRKSGAPRVGGTAVVYPRGVQQRLGISSVTRWRMERDGRLPARDFHVAGVAVGWRPETLAAAERGPAAG